MRILYQKVSYLKWKINRVGITVSWTPREKGQPERVW